MFRNIDIYITKDIKILSFNNKLKFGHLFAFFIIWASKKCHSKASTAMLLMTNYQWKKCLRKQMKAL